MGAEWIAIATLVFTNCHAYQDSLKNRLSMGMSLNTTAKNIVATPSLRATELGPTNDKIPLIFLPGWLCQAKPSFYDFAQAILNEGGGAERHMYLLDPPGIGLNAECAHLDGEQYSLKAQAMSVLRFIEDQNLSQAILVGHSFGTIVATNAYDMQPDSNPVKGVILLDPSPPFSGLIEQASNLVLQGSCEVTTKKNSKTIGSSFGAGSLIRTVTKEFPQDAPIENGEEVDMTVQADHTKMKVACGTIKKMNTYVSVAEINRLSKKLTPENAAIIYGQSQQSYGVHELDRGVSENDQVIKASFRRGEHFIHFPYTWNAGEQKGELGERDRCVTIVRVFLEEKFDGK